NLTINPLTTNGSLTTSACGSYTWAENGQTYTESGTYTNTVGCNTATLNLTINPLTTNGSLTTSACDSYTWAENGQTYTSSGTYTNTVGCNTATLNLTITPSTTNTTSQTACDSYTWSVNGQTYTSSGSYSNTVGCHTEVLNLTITPSTTNTSSASACDSYTWSVNGQTYTSSGSYSNTVGCHTEVLNLTITPSTTNTTSQTACDSYTWSVNGQTYTSSGSYSNTVGCHTEVLNLTITPSTSNTTSETACGSYTWSVNGQTYTSSGTYTSVSGCHTEILNLTINTSAQTYYADTDGDGFGAGAAILSCTGQPVGTSTNNTDCAPGDATKWRTGMFYTDADGDGYNNGFPQTSVCYGAATPAGYTLANIGTDCNDELATVNPNASEIPGNSIDDNCDGNIDEVYPTSFLNSTSCGVTLTNLANALYAYQLTTYVNSTGIPVQAYRFEVTNGSNVRTYEATANTFNLMNLPGGATYATTYSVRVSVKIQGFWRAYGSACTVTTPAVPNSTNITQPACGSTLANISNTIYCGAVSSATGYRFRVRNGATVVGTVDATVNRFSLTDLGIQNISFGTTYTIDVLLRFGSTWRPDSEYGTVCSITTPATPGASRVVNPACGSTITRLWTSIYAQQVIGAQGYRFVVTSTSPATSRVYTTPNSVFSLQNLPGGAQLGVTYTIRVDVLYNSSYVQGTQTCDITVSPAATRQTATAINVYDVKAYPNPFADNFKLELNSSSENEVSVKVYDMLGREVESSVSSVAALSNLEIGSRFPSGVYNIIVTQGDNVKTVRVIKR
ncbi:MAG: T9SS type A sorting domain-containing protein, partial [Bacteroidetes bacterium]|nr:T9SS type A sorting domain-containing protein [Bacteroidota bacterium]